MNSVVLYMAWAFGLMGLVQFVSVDPASADDFDGETTATALNVRSGPSVKHDVLTVVPLGTRVSVLEIDDGWAKISATNVHGLVNGWISGNYLDLYRIALPRVASAGIGDEPESGLVALPQPLEIEQQVDVAGAPDVIDEAVEVDEAAAKAEFEPTLDEENAAEALAKQVAAPIAPAKETDVEISSAAADDIAVQPYLSEPVEAPTEALVDPLTFEALDISCRRGYFSNALEACVADIKVDVNLPEDFAALISDTLNVKCDIGFAYDSGGKTLVETTSDVVKIDLEDGQGSTVWESRIDFLFRVDDVTRVEVGDISCGSVK